MKLIDSIKKVDYHGLEIYINSNHFFVAVDSDERIRSFEEEPNRGGWHWHSQEDSSDSLYDVDLEGMDWTDSLVSYKEESDPEADHADDQIKASTLDRAIERANAAQKERAA